MNRRHLLKNIATLGALAFLPGAVKPAASLPEKQTLHLIGLGAAGANIIGHIRQKGIKGNYTCISWFPEGVKPQRGIQHIDYAYPQKLRQCKGRGKQNIPLTTEMKAALAGNSYYVVACGLGGFTGTSLIYPALDFLKSEGKNYLALCTLPLYNEGRYRNNYALEKQRELSCFKNITYYNIAATDEKYGELPASKRFAYANEEVYRIFEKETAG